MVERNISSVSAALSYSVASVIQRNKWLTIIGPFLAHVVINALDMGLDINQSIKHFL